MTLVIAPSENTCGASITGIDLSVPLDHSSAREIRDAWLKHRVICFPDQFLSDDALEALTLAMGGFGKDPFFEPIAGRKNIAAILREADEETVLFAENWHSDWSFLKHPPAGTCLTAIEVPPVGGDTLFADQIAAFAALPDARKQALRQLTAIHSAKGAYSPDGTYGRSDTGRSMAIRPDESASNTFEHPLVQVHPETGEEAIFSCAGYLVGIKNIDQQDAIAMLTDLLTWQTRDEFVYRHRWEVGMVVMWDNRSVLHRATGGYQGYRRQLHRTTIAAFAAKDA